ncbi:MAG: hypothetical protein KatS3mg085_844 [Candidatus Dojkabacteria bacterium]|nr:MAG: hypothetical protein KatS3mg085_844 [Candidatus Dojkabacteria bacterium]
MNNELPKLKRIALIDTTFLFDQYSHRGIGRFGKETLKRLIPMILSDDDWDLHLLGFNDLDQNLIQIGLSNLQIEQFRDKIQFHSLGEPFPSTIKNFKLWYKLFQPIVNSVHPDVYFAVHFERGLPTLPKKAQKTHYVPRTIVVVHDVIPIQTNSFSSKSFLHNFIKKKFFMRMWKGVQNADKIITISNYSKEKIIEYGKIDSQKIKVIHLGVDEKFFSENKFYDDNDVRAVLEKHNLATKEYLFYDSGVEKNKGIKELFDTLKILFNYKKTKVPKLLVMTGSHFSKGRGKSIKPLNDVAKKVLQYAQKIGIIDQIQATGMIPDDELIILLHNAFAHINFSKLEGFNLGPVQAMAAQIPAIAANESCNPEVTQGKAFLVDIKKPKRVAKEIKKFLESPKAVSNQVKEAFEVAKSYKWETTSAKIWENIKN